MKRAAVIGKVSEGIQLNSTSSIENIDNWKLQLLPISIVNARVFFGAAIAVFLILCLPAKAQTGVGAQLSGQISDATGASVTGAKATARNPATGATRTAISNEAGYLLTNLEPGSYEVTIESEGFATVKNSGVMLTVGQQATLDFQLQLASGHDVVTISSETPVIEGVRSEQSQVIEERRIADLPINGRQFLDFVLLTPDAATGRSAAGDTVRPSEPNQIDITVGGLPEIATLINVDGANNMNGIYMRSRSTPSQEAVREFRVLTSGYGADSGPAAGGVVNIVTKSGSNDLHGELYEYFRNNAMDANNLLAPPGFNELRQNQFGANLGGAAVKDKLFFFGNYEGQRHNESPLYSSVLLNNLAAINNVKENILGLPGENIYGIVREFNYDTGLARMDYQISEKNRLALVYRYHNDRDPNISASAGQLSAPSNFREALIQDHDLTLNMATVISPNVVNQLLFQFNRRNFNFPSNTYQPYISIANTLDLGRHSIAPDGTRESRYQTGDTLGVVRGKHNFSFGADIDATTPTYIFSVNDPAYIIVPNLAGFLGKPPFPPGVPFAVQFAYNIGPDGSQPTPAPAGFKSLAYQNLLPYLRASSYQVNYGLFAMDSWRATPQLTINFGLRWDAFQYDPRFSSGYYKAFQPRVGVAYSMFHDKAVLRVAGGVYQGQSDFLRALVSQLIGQNPNYGLVRAGTYSDHPNGITQISVTNPAQAIPALLNFTHTGVYPSLSGPNAVLGQAFGLGYNLTEPRGVYSYQWSTQLDFRLPGDAALSVGYSGVRGLDISVADQFNVAPSANRFFDGTVNYATNPAAGFGAGIPNLVDPRMSPLQVYLDQDGQSIYHALNVAFIRRFAQHYALNANYVFSKVIDDVGADSVSDSPADPLDRHLERALSKQDVPQRFTTTFTSEGPSDTWLRNFGLSFIFTVQSGRYFNLFAGFDKNNDGNPITDRVSTIGRDTYQGGPLRSLDARLSRTFKFGEKTELDAFLEVFNLSNTLSVTDLNTVYGSPVFIGAIPRHLGDRAPAALSSFAQIQGISPPRQIQLALKLFF